MLVSCATGDGNLLLNVGPLPTGEIAADQQEVLRQMGRWLAKYGESIYATRGGPLRNGDWGGATFRDKTIYLHVLKWSGDRLQLPPLKAKVLQRRGPDRRLADDRADGGRHDARAATGPAGQDRHDRQAGTRRAGGRRSSSTVSPWTFPSPSCCSLDSPLDYQVFQRRSRPEGAGPRQRPCAGGDREARSATLRRLAAGRVQQGRRRV